MKICGHPFHVFEFQEQKLLFDSNSNYIFEIDEITADILRNLDSMAQVQRKYGKKRFANSLKRLKGIAEISSLHSTGSNSSKKRRERRISSLWLNISHICNLNCVYCFADGGCYGKKAALMDIQTAREAVDFLLKVGDGGEDYRLVFFGGEPLVNFPVMKSCVLYAEKEAKEKNVSVNFHLITNGTLLNQQIARFIRNHGVTVQISLDGPSNLNDKLRQYRNGKGSYTTVYHNLQMLRQEGIGSITARVTVTHHNCNVADLFDFLHEIGFDRVSLIPVMGDPEHDYSLTWADVSKIREQYRKLAEETVESIKNKGEIYPDWLSPYIFQLQNGRRRRYFCGAGFRFLAVTPQGKLYLCHRLVSKDHLEIGTLKDGMNIPKRLKSWGSCAVNERESCRKCWARYFCGGGCAASALERYGNVDRPEEIACEVLKANIENVLRVYYFSNTLQQEGTVVEDRGEDIPCAAIF
jgi:uncharacterized protein